jgi:hypothetical protein
LNGCIGVKISGLGTWCSLCSIGVACVLLIVLFHRIFNYSPTVHQIAQESVFSFLSVMAQLTHAFADELLTSTSV